MGPRRGDPHPARIIDMTPIDFRSGQEAQAEADITPGPLAFIPTSAVRQNGSTSKTEQPNGDHKSSPLEIIEQAIDLAPENSQAGLHGAGRSVFCASFLTGSLLQLQPW